MSATVYSAQNIGLEADIVDVEVDISKGLHSFNIVGLPDKAVEEAKDRINAAIKNSGFKAPARGNRKVIITLAPANIKKEGTYFDLAIALGYLKANKDISFNPTGKIFLGELSLNGKLRPIKGVLLLVQKAKEMGFTEIFVPAQNTQEAGLIEDIVIYPVNNLKEVIEHLYPQQKGEERVSKEILPAPPSEIIFSDTEYQVDFADIKGQETTKRGLEIAAAGNHNIAMIGPPGTGKTMLAKAFAGILPNLSVDEVIETTGIHSVAGTLKETIITKPPFRAPHHTASYVSLVGGGAWPRPGEITLSHRGVLFLDEFPEFEKRVIEAMRQPLEDRIVSISRSKHSATFPAHFILVAAMNPCPCGYRETPGKECVCTPSQLFKYERKLSGPIIDRIDLWLTVPQISSQELSSSNSGETSAEIKRRVEQARKIQTRRFKDSKIKTNSEISAKEIKKFAPLDNQSTTILNNAANRLGFSARIYHRIIKLARTIADLENSDKIKENHVLEALGYRPKKVL